MMLLLLWHHMEAERVGLLPLHSSSFAPERKTACRKRAVADILFAYAFHWFSIRLYIHNNLASKNIRIVYFTRMPACETILKRVNDGQRHSRRLPTKRRQDQQVVCDKATTPCTSTLCEHKTRGPPREGTFFFQRQNLAVATHYKLTVHSYTN